VFQAVRDTGKEPAGDDWRCIVRRGADGENGKDGRDGDDGKTPNVRGTWLEINEYRHLDIVTLDGGAFIAKRYLPGACPGEGWQLIAKQGKQGKPGARGVGLKGDRGAPGEPAVALSIDDDGLLTLTNGDGSTVECDLWPILSKLKH